MPGWKELNITAGTLVAFVLATATVGATALGLQSWVDNRVATAVDPVEQKALENRQRVRELRERLVQLEWKTRIREDSNGR